MKRFSLCLCLSVVNVLLAAAQQLPQQPPAPVHPKPGAHVVSITETSFSGMCYGYCVLETRAKPGKVEVLQYAFREQKNAYPGKKKKKGKLTPAEWRELETLASDQALLDLPERIGCPGCVDEIIGGVEIKFSDGTKKSVDHNYGGGPFVLDQLEDKLDSFRQRVLPKFNANP